MHSYVGGLTKHYLDDIDFKFAYEQCREKASLKSDKYLSRFMSFYESRLSKIDKLAITLGLVGERAKVIAYRDELSDRLINSK
jgi:hypothetical protein